MANENTPRDASSKSKAEDDRWGSDSETVERYDRERSGSTGEDAGGITNRPLSEEQSEQNELPERGRSKSDSEG